MFWSLGHVMSVIWINLLSSSGFRAVVSFLIQYSKCQYSFTLVLSINIPCSNFSLYQHWLLSCNPVFTAHVVIRTFKTLVCFFRYSFPASIWHPDSRCIAPSTHFPHYRHLSKLMCMLWLLFHTFVSIICSCILIIELAFLGSILHLSRSRFPHQSSYTSHSAVSVYVARFDWLPSVFVTCPLIFCYAFLHIHSMLSVSLSDTAVGPIHRKSLWRPYSMTCYFSLFCFSHAACIHSLPW